MTRVGDVASRFPLITSLLTERRSRVLAVLAVLFIGGIAAEYVRLIGNAPDQVIAKGSMVGGDYFVFREAALAAVSDRPEWIYAPDSLRRALEAKYPAGGAMRVSWQYPPAMFLLVAPLASFGYLTGFAVWEVLLLTVFLGAVVLTGVRGRALLFVLASPALVQSVITGQTGMWTGALLVVGARFAADRPLLAGLAIGLLTTKPQFGLLVPVALLAAGLWRTIGWATLTACLLHGVAWLAFGTASMEGFLTAMRYHAGNLAGGTFPHGKLVTVWGASQLLGFHRAALVLQAIATAAMALWVGWTWRRLRDPRAGAAVLAAATLLATPYALYYEVILLALPTALLAARAEADGWLDGERLMLGALWLGPLLLPGSDGVPSLPLGFLYAALAVLVVARRQAVSSAKVPPLQPFRSKN